MNAKQKRELLSNWITLNKGLAALTENEVRELLKAEQRGAQRASFLTRLHARLGRLQRHRERKELLEGGANAKAAKNDSGA